MVLDETLSTDSERFLFAGAVEDAVRSVGGRAKSPSTVVIARVAESRANARSGCFNQLFLPYRSNFVRIRS